MDKKPNTNIVVPKTIEDMTELLDNLFATDYVSPIAGVLSADEYYYPTIESYNNAYTNVERSYYIWEKDIYQGNKDIQDWNAPYKAIFYSNVVLEAHESLSEQEKQSGAARFVEAWALFNRSYNFFNLVQIFSPTYDQATANIDLGVPLKLSSDINKIVQRSTIQETYDQILQDLRLSLSLFTNIVSDKNPNRPSRSAAYALMARVYLTMRDYDSAEKYADSSLSTYSKLLNYNDIDTLSTFPFSDYNEEVLLSSISITTYSMPIVAFGTLVIDTNLIKLYDANDLRKNIYFSEVNGDYLMKGAYSGTSTIYPFMGLAVDEVYLIKAECLARRMLLPEATSVLNELLITRYKTGTYIPFVSNDKSYILSKIIDERRKELVWRGLRWSDIKRLNKEGANISLERILGEVRYLLPPNDPRYVMPIPDDEISLSHIEQNAR